MFLATTRESGVGLPALTRNTLSVHPGRVTPPIAPPPLAHRPERHRSHRVAWLRGNSDRELYPGEEGLAPAEVVEEARSKLSEDEIEFLHALPPTQRIGDVLYCHASPRNDVDIFTERTPEDRLVPLFAGLDVPTVVCGHTHTQYERTVGGVRVVNAGSVGMPYEDEPGAYWLLDLVHRRTPYDGAELKASREEAVSEFTERGL